MIDKLGQGKLDFDNKKTGEFEMALGDELLAMREHLGVSQDTLCEGSGLDSSGYRYYEQGKRCPTLKVMIRIAMLFDKSIDEILARVTVRLAAMRESIRKKQEKEKRDRLRNLIGKEATGEATPEDTKAADEAAREDAAKRRTKRSRDKGKTADKPTDRQSRKVVRSGPKKKEKKA